MINSICFKRFTNRIIHVTGERMAVILLSIKPEYAEKIFAGTKKYEYRRHIASEKVEKIIVYSTAPVKQVIRRSGC